MTLDFERMHIVIPSIIIERKGDYIIYKLLKEKSLKFFKLNLKEDMR